MDSATQNERGLGGGVDWAGKYEKVGTKGYVHCTYLLKVAN